MYLASLEVDFYPTGSPVDNALRAVKARVLDFESYVGKEEIDWLGILASFYIYRYGARARWHTDDRGYSGAFVYYLHHRWERDWGGELLIEHIESQRELSLDAASRFSRGSFVCAQPNRLVLLKAGTSHSVAPVSGRGEESERISLAGFFVTPQRVEELLQALSSERMSE